MLPKEGIRAVLRACPNLTHLSLARSRINVDDQAEEREGPDRDRYLDEELPEGFALPRLRHLDLSGLHVTSGAFLALLRACSASLECLFLRCSFPRLESLDVSFTNISIDELRLLRSRIRSLRELYALLKPCTCLGEWKSAVEELGWKPAVAALVNAGLRSGSASRRGRTPLHLAVDVEIKSVDVGLVEALLDLGADPLRQARAAPAPGGPPAPRPAASMLRISDKAARAGCSGINCAASRLQARQWLA
eukprot:tig00020510_g9821.t1